MSPRFYFSLWFVLAFTSLAMWVLGTVTMLGLVVLGFLAFGLTFVGMMCVLPSTVAHSHEEWIEAEHEHAKEVKATQKARMPGLATLKSA